jgi:hypothetical protein
VAAALIVAAVTASAGKSDAPERSAAASTRSPMVGVFTGEFVDGAPVYRLPPINVIGHREADVAKAQRDERCTSPMQRIL